MASALETLCGQSYGAKQYRMLGIHMQRSMFTLMIVGIPIAIIWANTKSILIFLGQDPEISHEAGKYAQVMVPTIFAYGLLVSLNRFLQTQHIVFPMVFFSGVATLLHVLLCWVMVFKCELGNRGAAISSSIAYWFNVLMLSLYVKFSPSCAKTWTGFSKEAFQCVSFVRLAIPSALMVCLEMWSFEMVVLLSGLLPNPKLETSVLSICLNTVGVIWMIPLGLGGAVSTRVSNELGAGHPQVARLAVRVVFALVFVEAIVIGVVTILIRNIWGYAYSNEVEVVKHVAEMMPILAVSNFLDGFQGVLSGTTRGCGRQKFGAYVNLGSYYLVGLPLAAVFAFVLHIGGKGLWLGIICALSVQVVSFLIVTLCTDWEQEAKKAADRVYDSLVPENTVS
ncbi:putative multi antimicrobial extrusion protein [Lupinus albus]|uniref:Putative multi antimicrobial extrusion protein n=1 Tax=Lupinus albus TaxID=3870 RepID=A0A6A4P3X6_LUPAL|nr:putative multi antimicrobial extrusion protein [Lupinus albus]